MYKPQANEHSRLQCMLDTFIASIAVFNRLRRVTQTPGGAGLRASLIPTFGVHRTGWITFEKGSRNSCQYLDPRQRDAGGDGSRGFHTKSAGMTISVECHQITGNHQAGRCGLFAELAIAGAFRREQKIFVLL
jgi:hypothetical protein